MAEFTRPDVYAREQDSLEGPILAAQTGFGGMLAVTEKGPVQGVPIRSTSFSAWQRVFGGREAASRGDAAYEAKAFFDEGGQELITVRVCHYTDIDDATTYAGGVASNTSITDPVAATSATKTLAAGPYALTPGQTVILDVDNVGGATATFDAARATSSGSGLSISDLTGLTFIVSIGGISSTTTFAGTESTASLAADKINANLIGGRAVVNAGEIDIESDIQGTDAVIIVGAGTANTELGQTAGTYNGTGDVGNILAVTEAEAKTVLEADTTSTLDITGSAPEMASPTTGTSSELDFTGGTALTAFGLSVETIVGTALGATYSTLKLEAGYHGVASPGAAGNNLSKKITQNPKHVSLGAGSDVAVDITATDTAIQVLSLSGLTEKSVIKLWDVTNTEYAEVLDVRTVVTAGVVSFFVDVTSGLTNSFLASAVQMQSQEFDLEIYENNILVESKFTQMSMLDTADNYFVTLINDENLGSEYVVATDLDADPPGLGADIPATDSVKAALTGGTSEIASIADSDWIGSSTGGTGLYGFDTIREFMPICTPGKNSSAVVNSAKAYVEDRVFMEYIAFVDAGMSATDAIAYRNNVLGTNSSYVALYAGGMKVYDPIGVGSNPRRSISGVGAMMGLRSRIDSLPSPNGGPWQAPAGEGDYGTLKSALDVATEYGDNVTGDMNAAHVNVIRKFGNLSPVTVWGSRTLDASVKQNFRYIQTRRFFNYVKKSIVDSTRWAVHRNNDYRLWSKLRDAVDAWLLGLMPDGAFPTQNKDLAYFVKCGITDGVMTAADRDDGKVIGQVGLAPQPGGEFIIWDFTQYDSGYDVAEQ